MEKYMDVMKQTVELSETMSEALEHIKIRVNEGNIESTIQLVDDTMIAFSTIVKSMQRFLYKLPPNQIEEHTDMLVKGFQVLTTAYEQGQSGKILEVLQFTILPAYKKWSSELEKHLQSYIVS
ncbi:hypothetical protein DFP93_10856 [Aneurinibacillus soli]|uniref:DUF8042 domain-containing protein n=1 Tax=Aneurinibacillus soli TaxID=1500254 RepID=A0A0U5AWH2_9BACL|nr:hypothetical protein [Aneurinibacillus soli]PYE61483.1 hypothetical protein DFP93_10856 [Aneurinibacillus soli]BAU26562.1 hypothetical protein CB4_00689 [Aneurinibacillus soli]